MVGFDDLDYAILVDPPLTTLHQPRAALGHAAAADLLKRMARDAPDLPPTRARFAAPREAPPAIERSGEMLEA